MARRFLAPQHRADAPPKFIARDDTAWARGVVERALDGDPELAALTRYLTGETRFDLGAADFVESNADNALIDISDAEVWTLRGVPVEYRIEVLDLIRRGQFAAAHTLGFVHGVMRLEGALGKAGEALAAYIEELPRRRTRKHVARLLELIDDYSYSVVNDVGEAATNASDDRLSEAEGKP